MGWFKKTDEADAGSERVEASPRAHHPAPPTASAPPPPPTAPAVEADQSTRASLASLLTGRPAAPAPPSADSVIAEDSASVFLESVDIEGSLEGQGDVVLRGRVRGSINISGSLVVTQTGSVQADVCAREVINAGTVEGNIAASEKVRVQSTGLVKGDIDSPSIVIDDGGGVEGFVQMEPPGGEEFGEDNDLPPRAGTMPAQPQSMRFTPRALEPAPAAGFRPGVLAGLPTGAGLPGGNGNGHAAMPQRPLPAAVLPQAEQRVGPPLGDPLAVFFGEDSGDETGPGRPVGPAAPAAADEDPFADPPPAPRPPPEL